MSFNSSYAEAVLIFNGKDIVREMHFSEFEAVLEGFVPLAEQAAQKVHAVYLRVGRGPAVSAAVFFIIDFDKGGFADRRWNIPIEQLADTSAEGPDLGGGPIRLACRSQCAIAWHQQQLWDPQMTPQCNHFVAIKNAIKKNTLQLSIADDAPVLVTEVPSKPVALATNELGAKEKDAIEAQWRKRIAQTIKEARLKVSTVKRDGELKLQAEKDSSRQDAAVRAEELAKLLESLSEEQARGQELNQLVERQEQKLKGLREYFEQKLNNLKNGDEMALDTLRGHLESQFEAEILSQKQSYEEQLQMRDVEVMYRDTQLAGLNEEIDKLRLEKQSLLEASGNNLLEKVHKSGISFVSFQPGAGHMTIPVDDVADFIEDSDRYTARKCRVDVELFKSWRRHYQNPVCQEPSDEGGACNVLVARTDRPSDFVSGQSDRCSAHQHAKTPIVQVVS